MERLILFIGLFLLICNIACAKADDEVIFTKDKNIPSYYVFIDERETFNRNTKAEDVKKHLKTLLKLNTETTLELVDTLTDIVGGFHESYQQYYKGVEVDGKRCSVHYTQDGQMKMINGNLSTIEGIDVLPVKKNSDVKTLAIAAVRKDLTRRTKDGSSEIWESINIDSIVTYRQARLVVYIKNDTSYLAYKYMLSSPIIELNQCVLVDANSGALLDIHGTTCSASTTAQSVYSGIVPIETEYNSGTYILRDATRGGGIKTKKYEGAYYYGGTLYYNYSNGSDYESSNNTWTNLSELDRAGIDAHWGMEKTYDFYLNKFGRNSYDNNGNMITSYVNAKNYDGSYLEDAMWMGTCIVFGRRNNSPMTSIDVIAHELTHGVTETTSNLSYQKESGAINEGLSDAFGACVEKEFKPNRGDSIWLCGEAFDSTPRSMFNPVCKYYHGTGWVDVNSSTDHGGVHTNSGVFNYWFYLLVNGGSGTNEGGYSYTVDSIGFEKAAQICYLANAAYLKSNHQYLDARYCTMYAAQALNYNADIIHQVSNAWDAVGVYDNIVGNNINYGSSVFTATTVPDSCTVNWILSGDNAANYIVENNTPAQNQCRVTLINGAEFSGSPILTLKAQIIHGGAIISTAKKQQMTPYIIGPMIPCGYSAYSASPLPSNYTVEWEADGENLENDLNPNGIQPESPYTYVIIHNTNETHFGTLTATVKEGNTVKAVLNKTIDSSGGFSGTWYQKPVLTDTVNSSPKSFYDNSLLSYVPGRKIYLQSTHFIGADITHSQSGVNISGWSNNNGIISFTPVQQPMSVGSITINGTASSSCKKFKLRLLSAPTNPIDPPLLSLNPEGTNFEFSIHQREQRSSTKNETNEWRLTIVRSDSSFKVFDKAISSETMNVNVSAWTSGIYIATAQIGNQQYSLKFSVGE